jgi:IclR family transcriptional regulator, pca regulon regulatory protein
MAATDSISIYRGRARLSSSLSETAEPDGGRQRHFVQSLERGLAVIRALSEPGPGLTLSDVARETSLTRAAARRFLLTLEDLGYARCTDRRFSLTPRVLELGYSFLSGLTLPEIAQPHLRELVEQVHESSSVSVLEGDEIVYVAREPTQRIMSVAIAVGTRFPAYATSMGRVLLAGLADRDVDQYLSRVELRALTSETVTDVDALRVELGRVRRQGWAVVDQELEHGLRSVAAPIVDPSGRVVAAINLSTQAGRRTLEAVRRTLLPPLLESAERIAADLASSRRP